MLHKPDFRRHRSLSRPFWFFIHYWTQNLKLCSWSHCQLREWIVLTVVTWEIRGFSLHTFFSNFRDCVRGMWLGHRGRPVGCLSVLQIFSSGRCYWVSSNKLRTILLIVSQWRTERDSRQYRVSDSSKQILSVGLPWTSDQHDAENSTSRYRTITKDGFVYHFRDSNPHSLGAVIYPSLRVRRHRNRAISNK